MVHDLDGQYFNSFEKSKKWIDYFTTSNNDLLFRSRICKMPKVSESAVVNKGKYIDYYIYKNVPASKTQSSGRYRGSKAVRLGVYGHMSYKFSAVVFVQTNWLTVLMV